MVLCTIIKKLYFGFSEKVRLVYLGFALSEKIRLLFFRFGLLAIAGNVAPQVLVLVIAPNFWPGPRAGPGRQNFESCTGWAGPKFMKKYQYLENGKRYQNSDRLWGPMVMLRNPKVGKNGNFGLTHFTF